MNNTTTTYGSPLRTLRALVPARRLSRSETLRIAELQANRLLELFDITGPQVPSELVSEFPYVEVRLEHDMPVSGSTHWANGRWVITLNADEPYVRRRFSLMHEFKHVLDHTTKDRLYGDTANDPRATEQAELVANYFAACVLMPKRWLKGQWFGSGQQLAPLARRLHVSTRALSVRLWYLGIAPETQRCSPNVQPSTESRRSTRYFRYTPLGAGVAA